MKLYLITVLLVLSSLLIYKAQGTRPGHVALSATNNEGILKVSSSKGSIQDYQLLSNGAKFSSGINRKLMIDITSSRTTNIDSKVRSSHQLAGKEETSNYNWKKDVEQSSDVISDITEMDYSPARKKSPIHN